MVNNYSESIGLHVGKELKKELEKEAILQNKSLGGYVREIVMNRNEHKKIEGYEVIKPQKMYKITFVDYRQYDGDKDPIERIVHEFNDRKNN